jgi:TPR repeat protein
VQQNYAQAAAYYLDASNRGNFRASFALGSLYQLGQGVEQNYQAALHYYEIAANNGLQSAMFNLGRFHQFGWGVPADFSRALQLYLMAADRGHAMSQLLVGQALLLGQDGTAVDEVAGFAWMLRAAEQGVLQAQTEVGLRYLVGKGVDADEAKAQYWNRQAAIQGQPRAQLRLASSLIRSENVDRATLIDAAKWLILSFHQPEAPDEDRHSIIEREWSYLASVLSEADIEEARLLADELVGGESGE